MNLANIPGFLEAVAAERFARDAAFLPVTETVAGQEVSPLTVRHVCILTAVGSPFICGGRLPTGADIAAFLWVVSPKYRPAAATRRRWFVRGLRRLPFVETAKAIQEYVARAFADLPPGDGKATVGFYSSTAAIVDLLASEYGWSEEAILALPLCRAIQYSRAIERRRCLAAGVKPVQFNPSDKFKRDYLDRLNQPQPATN